MFPGKPLPKRVLRPFLYNEYVALNKNKYVVLSRSNKSIIFDRLAFPGYAFGAIALLGWLVFDESDYSKLYIAMGFICISLIMQVSSKYLKPTRFIVFNREKNLISVPKGIFSKQVIDGPWKEWTARLTSTVSSVGAPRHGLTLVHIPTKYSTQLDTCPGSYEYLLSYWSFIVQYMSGGSYPNVPELKNEKKLTDGLGTWEHWEKIGKFESDPYRDWLQQLKDDPSLDIAYQDK